MHDYIIAIILIFYILLVLGGRGKNKEDKGKGRK